MKKFGTSCFIVSLAAALFSAVSCDNVIYDDLEPCVTECRMKFVYDYNILYADAFRSEVGSLDVWIFDTDGRFLWHGSEYGEALKKEGYSMTVPLEPGTYDVVVWGGLKDQSSYILGSDSPASPADLGLKIKTSKDERGTYVGGDLTGLYHSCSRVTFEAPEFGGYSDVVMQLKKNTNVIRVMLQYWHSENVAGKVMNPEDFDFIIEDSVAEMAYDNSIVGDAPFEYRWWMKNSVSAGFDFSKSGDTQTEVNGLLAERTVGRLMADRKPVLKVIRNTDGEEIIRLPLVKYLLMIKGEYRKGMSDQEFLDRLDEYNLTFFLDGDDRWYTAAGIHINSWVVVPDQNTEF